MLSEIDPEASFAFCNGWFDRFKARHKISLRWTKGVLSKCNITDHQELLKHLYFLWYMRWTAGKHQIANMDQTPSTYAGQGDKTVRIRPFLFGYSDIRSKPGGASGQCTVQLTDGEPRVKPLLIFHGKGHARKVDIIQYKRCPVLISTCLVVPIWFKGLSGIPREHQYYHPITTVSAKVMLLPCLNQEDTSSPRKGTIDHLMNKWKPQWTKSCSLY